MLPEVVEVTSSLRPNISTIVEDLSSAQAAQAQLRGSALEKAQQEAEAEKAAFAETLRAAQAERDAALVRAGAADRRAAQLEAELGEAKVRIPHGPCCRLLC